MRPMHVLRVSGRCECVAGHFNMPNGYNFIGYGHYHWMLKSDVTSHYHNRSRTILIPCLIIYGCWAQRAVPAISTLPRLN